MWNDVWILLLLLFMRTHHRKYIGCCERPSICALLGLCNTWPGKGRAREFGRKREGVMNEPGDAGKEWQTAGSPSGLYHRSASVSLGPPSDKAQPWLPKCICVFVCGSVMCTFSQPPFFLLCVRVWMWNPRELVCPLQDIRMILITETSSFSSPVICKQSKYMLAVCPNSYLHQIRAAVILFYVLCQYRCWATLTTTWLLMLLICLYEY